MNGKKQKRLTMRAVNKHLSALRDTERSLIGYFQCIKILTWLQGWGGGEGEGGSKRNISFIPQPRCDFFCFIPPSLGAKFEF